MSPSVTIERLWPAGILRVPDGTCPGCGLDSHPRQTCDGRTTEEVIAALWPGVWLRPLEQPEVDPR
jgi:hypothetical protein